MSVTLRNNNQETYAVDNVTNQYDASGTYTVTHTYDQAGNLAADHHSYTYSYDYENRLIKIQEGAGTVADYAYDALGRRIKTVAPGTPDVTRYYYYDGGWRVLAESDENKTLKRDYIYGNYLDEVLYVRDLSASEDYYYAHDHLYSPVALLYQNGSILERYEYDAYGRRHVFEDDFDAKSGSSYGLPIAFTGQRVDVLDGGDLELMYYKNRYYDVEMGRFLTRDPIGYADGMNLYQYVQSSPVMSMDVIGHRTETKVRSNNDPRYGKKDPGGVKKPFDEKQCMVSKMFCMEGSTHPCCQGNAGNGIKENGTNGIGSSPKSNPSNKPSCHSGCGIGIPPKTNYETIRDMISGCYSPLPADPATSTRSARLLEAREQISQELLLCMFWKESSLGEDPKFMNPPTVGLGQISENACKDVDRIWRYEPGTCWKGQTSGDLCQQISNTEMYLAIAIAYYSGNAPDSDNPLEGGIWFYGDRSDNYVSDLLECEKCMKAAKNTSDGGVISRCKAEPCFKAIHP